jgi:Fe2+ transport system protein B
VLDCDSDERTQLTQKKLEEAQTYIQSKQKTLDAEVKVLRNNIQLIDSILLTITPMSQYKTELDTQVAELKKDKLELERGERKERRRFLDGSPQEGVSSILGQKTSDDKVLIFFWITLLTIVCITTYIVFSMYELPHSIKNYGIIVGISVLLAYILIYRYA